MLLQRNIFDNQLACVVGASFISNNQLEIKRYIYGKYEISSKHKRKLETLKLPSQRKKKLTEYSYSIQELKGMHHRCFLGFKKPKHYQRHQRNTELLWQKTLTNRRQHVYDNGTNSGMFDIIC